MLQIAAQERKFCARLFSTKIPVLAQEHLKLQSAIFCKSVWGGSTITHVLIFIIFPR